MTVINDENGLPTNGVAYFTDALGEELDNDDYIVYFDVGSDNFVPGKIINCSFCYGEIICKLLGRTQLSRISNEYKVLKIDKNKLIKKYPEIEGL